jgi:hypothetical protein
MADLKDLAEQYGLEDYEQLLGGYPNATKFITGLKDAAVRSVPTTEQMRDPNFIIDTAGLGGAIKAYHGTPHLFDRFDMSKIGTGEGAQAYGHGLYFAQEPSIAESYRKNLSAKDIAINDKKSDLITDMLDKSVLDYITTYGNKNAALDALNEKINYGSKFDDIDWLKNVKNKLELSKIEQPSGNLYETSIRWPNAEREATDPLGEHHLLDWDQPLSEQSDYVRNKLKKSDFYKNANKAYKDQKQWYLDPSQKTGESFLKYMRSGYDDESASGIKDAEQYLKNLDIPGLKYLDATSRSTDKGTRNYVMFGDEYPEIIKRAGSLDELQEKNLNKQLIEKYLSKGKLSPDDMAQYEQNALAMETPLLQRYNVENALANPNREAYKNEFDDQDYYHGTSHDFKSFKPSESGRLNEGVYVTPDKKVASMFSKISGSKRSGESANTMPLKINPKNIYTYENYGDIPLTGTNNEYFKQKGIDALAVKDKEMALFDPSMIRSRFAAFDPLRKNSSSIMASGLLGDLALKYANDDEPKYAEGGIVKAQDQNENLGKLAEMLGSARDVGNQYTVPSWVPLAGGVGAGDLLMGKTPEEIENWSYGNAPMQIPEMSNVPQFKRGRAQSLADALTTLAPGVKATEGLPAGLSFIGPKSKNWDKVAAELAAKKLDEGADPAEVWREHLIGRMPDKTLFSEISDKDALYHEHGKDFYDSTINKKSQLLKHGRDTASYPLNVQDMLAHSSFYENYPNLEATELKYLPETSNAIGGLSFADNGDPVLNIHGMLPNDEAKSTMLHELQHAIQRQEGWGQGGDLGSASSFYIENHLSPKLKALNTSLIENGKLRDTITNEDEYAANVLRHKQIAAERDKLNDEISNIENNQAPKLRLYNRLAGEAQARATQDRMDMDMAQRRENYPLAGGKLSDIPLEELIYKYEGNGPSLSVKKPIKNLNQALLDKYIERGYLPEDELVKYEKNAAKMRNAGRQDINIQNAQANPEYEAYKAEYDFPFMHGTERLDRVLSKEGLDPKRATSGPMLYGTDSSEIASSYAKNKQDTSMIDDDDWDYSKAFTVSPQQLGHRGTIPYTVEQSWNYLDPEVKRDILTKAPRVGYSDLDQWQGDFVLHPEGEGNAINQSHYDYLLKQSRNNPIKAMRDYWLDSGNLFNEEEKMSQLYRLAGYPHEISQEMAPWTKREGVLTGVSRITKPLDTSNVDDLRENVIPALKQAFKNDKSRKKDYGADSWDKNTRYTPKEWVNELESDLNKGENSYVWTSIPDKITSELKRLGYNGIYDTGGKSAGADSHQVTIPFNPSQIRSKFAAFDPILKNSPNLLAGTALGSVLLRDDDQGYAQGGSVDKDSLQLDKPQRTPNHPTKSHIVKTMVDGKEKIIRFGEQGAETAGKPKEGESDRMTAKRESFKARHAKNIAKGKSSAAYWADKVKWAEGGSVNSDILEERLYNRAMAHFDDLMANKYADGGSVSEFEDPAHERLYRRAMAHFDDLVNA